MNDLKNHKHGDEGVGSTHSVCNKHNIGGESVCCECSGKTDCSSKTPPSSTHPLKCVCEKPCPILLSESGLDLGCENCNLPIHPTTEPKCSKGHMLYTSMGGMFCECTGFPGAGGGGGSPPPVEGEWAEAFDDNFYEGERNSVYCREHKIFATPSEIKSFISKLLHSEREKADKLIGKTHDDGFKEGALRQAEMDADACANARAEERERILKSIKNWDTDKLGLTEINNGYSAIKMLQDDLRDKLSTHND